MTALKFPDFITPAHIANLPPERRRSFMEFLSVYARRSQQRAFFDLFPDNDNVVGGRTIYRRELYQKHLEFFRVGLTHRERAFIAANRVGKTIAGGYETTAHLTGLYPHWWEGKRFAKPISAWACGETNETTREIIQKTLLGGVTYEGNRKVLRDTDMMIPGHLIGRITWKQGVQDLVDTVWVRHVSGGWSRLSFKAYEQGRGSFQGTAKDLIWLDEECPLDVYGECVIRTATTDGILMLTFTPLLGLTETVMQFMEQEV